MRGTVGTGGCIPIHTAGPGRWLQWILCRPMHNPSLQRHEGALFSDFSDKGLRFGFLDVCFVRQLLLRPSHTKLGFAFGAAGLTIQGVVLCLLGGVEYLSSHGLKRWPSVLRGLTSQKSNASHISFTLLSSRGIAILLPSTGAFIVDACASPSSMSENCFISTCCVELSAGGFLAAQAAPLPR